VSKGVEIGTFRRKFKKTKKKTKKKQKKQNKTKKNKPELKNEKEDDTNQGTGTGGKRSLEEDTVPIFQRFDCRTKMVLLKTSLAHLE
jgi:hypothetical protein